MVHCLGGGTTMVHCLGGGGGNHGSCLGGGLVLAQYTLTLFGDFSVSKKGDRLISGLLISTSILCLSMAVEVGG